MSGFAEAMKQQADALVELQMRALLTDMRDFLQEEAPVLTGAFRDSLTPFAGSPLDWPEGSTVDGVMANWKGAGKLGVYSEHPAARKLAFHHLSKKVPANWVDLGLDRAAERTRT